MRLSGDFKAAIALLERMAQKLNVSDTNKGRAFSINLRIAISLLDLGEIDKAEGYVKRNVALLSEAHSWRNAQPFFSSFEASREDGKGRLFLARGQFMDAEAAYIKAEGQYRDALVKSRAWNMLCRRCSKLRSTTRRSSLVAPRHFRAGTPKRKLICVGLAEPVEDCRQISRRHGHHAHFLSELLLEQIRLKNWRHWREPRSRSSTPWAMVAIRTPMFSRLTNLRRRLSAAAL